MSSSRLMQIPADGGSTLKMILGVYLVVVLVFTSWEIFPSQSLGSDLAKKSIFFPETEFFVEEPFLSAFLYWGGVSALGYPISRPFLGDGFLSQAFQRGILQWKPAANQVEVINLLNQFFENGLDDYLFLQEIPRHLSDDDGEEIRFGWLTQPQIKKFYFENPDPVRFFGLPTSFPERHGPFITQRFRKGVLQLWVEDVPEMPSRGSVVGVLVGDFAKTFGLIPEEAQIPYYSPYYSVVLTGLEQEMLDAVNAERRKAALYDLTLNHTLTEVARLHSQDMANRKYFSHYIAPDNITIIDLLLAYGLTAYIGEIIGRTNAPDSQSVNKITVVFMNSPNHRTQLLGSYYSSVGVGVAVDESNMKYFTIIFWGD